MNKNFMSYLFYNKKVVFGTLLLILLSSALAQLTPYIQGLIVDIAILTQQELTLIMFVVIFAIILILDNFTCFYLKVAMTNSGYDIAQTIRSDIFKQIIYKPYDFFENNKNGDILLRTNNYIYDIGSYISQNISHLFIGLARFLIIFTFIFAMNYKIALVLTLLYVCILLYIFLSAKKIVKQGREYKKLELQRNSLILQNLQGIEIFLAYNTKFRYLKNYIKIGSEYGKARKKFYYFYNTFFPIIDFLVCLGTLITYILTFSYAISILEIGVVIAIISYTSRVVSPMQIVAKGLATLFETTATVNQVFDLYNNEETKQKLVLEYKYIDIRCENLNYSNEQTSTNIKDLNLHIRSCQKVLIVGRHGLGKTAFSNLLIGLYKANSGKVLYNEIDIQEISSHSLSNMVSVTSDYVGIFNSTIYENVRYAKPTATKKEVLHAIKLSGLNFLTKKLERGYNTQIRADIIGEGDKQLISFARVILKNTPIVIVDEVARDMEERIKKQFLKKLNVFCQDKTLIYIAENNKINLKFDKIIYFKKINKYIASNIKQ
ncbi:MAG: ABC transporter ATP-binding protein [Clostridia bacterium]|nr:ABC transporter ATP-binding protein [Clostridia bacterium]